MTPLPASPHFAAQNKGRREKEIMTKGKTKFYTREVLVKVANVSREALGAVAIQLEAQTKVNITANNQVDTGFMLNSVYAVMEDGSTYSQAAGQARAQAADREMAPERELPSDAMAGVGVGAEYAVFQEARTSFLYRAAQMVREQAPDEIRRVWRRRWQ